MYVHHARPIILMRVKKFVLKNTVLWFALVAAAVTCFFVPFDKEYIGYFDFGTLGCLFCTLFQYYRGVPAVFVSVLILDPKAVLKVDYLLLLTFCAFFVFSGNMARIPVIQSLLSAVVGKSPLPVGTLSCQIIGNVPSSVLLSHFTTDYRNLLVAVNIGGPGTPIASLASLITLNSYRNFGDGKVGKYVGLFSLVNFSYLIVLVAVQLMLTYL